jgi:D-sedoheptulose 7-phosphate isomerase
MYSDLETLIARYPQLTELKKEIESSFDILSYCYKNGGKLLLCGNGGSASDSDHIAGELLKGFRSRRKISGEQAECLGENLASKLQGSLPAIPLPALSAVNTAFINDCDPDYVYAQLTYGLGKEGDVLLAISTSGNSTNVVHAAEVAKAKGMKTISLTGRTGGKLKSLSDSCLNVPEDETFKIQELHLPIYHCLCLMLETAFFD